jgi:hypothetical protein
MQSVFARVGLSLPALVLAGLVLALSGCGKVEPPPASLLAEARGDQCVEPTDVMRRDHMKILLQERDEAKRYGRRNLDHSIVGCVDCHVSPAATREDPSTHFCMACHEFNAVRMDCFQCHTDRPSDAAPSPHRNVELHESIERHLAVHANASTNAVEVSIP